ncbi:hypothetical protein SCP_0205270 [Sparassis crispa]|uniref:Uncharacterized protein n=1 Tax=Sparassis crispa TaxID=139825 RepID=A0A401GAZ5_9APHY|nr:hypothetical protein SCP_0205270 [Sparassis crispa]GBE79329.1 hypothetical protein SCP_0205270 [Sparassis crispa]
MEAVSMKGTFAAKPLKHCHYFVTGREGPPPRFSEIYSYSAVVVDSRTSAQRPRFLRPDMDDPDECGPPHVRRDVATSTSFWAVTEIARHSNAEGADSSHETS